MEPACEAYRSVWACLDGSSCIYNYFNDTCQSNGWLLMFGVSAFVNDVVIQPRPHRNRAAIWMQSRVLLLQTALSCLGAASTLLQVRYRHDRAFFCLLIHSRCLFIHFRLGHGLILLLLSDVTEVCSLLYGKSCSGNAACEWDGQTYQCKPCPANATCGWSSTVSCNYTGVNQCYNDPRCAPNYDNYPAT